VPLSNYSLTPTILMRIAFRERLIRTPCTRLLAGRRAINDAAVSQPAAAAAAMQ